MRQTVCKLAKEGAYKDEDWRRHAAGCQDCGEMLNVGEWMDGFASRTHVPRALPSAGLLLFKAKLNWRLSLAERAARPINAMALIALFVAVASTAGVAFGTESRFGSIVIEALGLLATYAVAIAIAAAVTAIICLAIAFILKRLEA